MWVLSTTTDMSTQAGSLLGTLAVRTQQMSLDADYKDISLSYDAEQVDLTSDDKQRVLEQAQQLGRE